jgi:hypothetical protein
MWSRTVVDLVDHAGGQRAQRRHALGLRQTRGLGAALAHGQHLLDRARERGGAARLGEKEIGVDRGRRRAARRGERDHRHLRELGIASLLESELPSVHHGHHEIEHHDVGTHLAHPIERLAAILDRGDVEAMRGQRLADGFAQLCVVFDQEHSAAFSGVRMDHASSSALGSRVLQQAI